MREKNKLLMVVALSLSLVFTACAAPQAPPATPTATPPPAGAPAVAEGQQIRMHLQEMQGEMVRLHQSYATMGPEERAQMDELMVAFAAETSRFMVMMDGVMEQMTPEERQEATEILQRMQTRMQRMHEAMPDTMPMPAPTGPANMGEMGRQMEEMHRQMPDHMQQMGPAEMQQMLDAMSDMMGDMDQLMEIMEPAMDRMNRADRQALLQQVERMHDIVHEMLDVAGLEPLTPTPAPAGAPLPGQARIVVSDQTLQNGAMMIDRVDIPRTGWVAVHEIAPDGSAGAMLGAAELQAGVNSNVTVQLDPAPSGRTELMAKLHEETAGPNSFDFPDADPPLMADGQFVMTRFTVQP